MWPWGCVRNVFQGFVGLPQERHEARTKCNNMGERLDIESTSKHPIEMIESRQKELYISGFPIAEGKLGHW